MGSYSSLWFVATFLAAALENPVHMCLERQQEMLSLRGPGKLGL